MRLNGMTYHLRDQQLDPGTYGDDGHVELEVNLQR
jgi:hypothetical protein